MDNITAQIISYKNKNDDSNIDQVKDNQEWHTTFLAVEEILLATNSANTTIITMILPLLSVIIVKFADITEVISHFHPTIGTNFRNLKKYPNSTSVETHSQCSKIKNITKI